MMKEYNLYLDESYDKDKKKYLIAGFAIDTNNEEVLRQKMNEIKEIFWDKDYIKENETVLHCTELSMINNNRKNKMLKRFIKRDCYNIFKSMNSDEIKEKMDKLMISLIAILRTMDIAIFGCLIDEEIYDYLYPDRAMHEENYNIGITCILENYVYFLKSNSAVGNVVYESMNEEKTIKSSNVKMHKNFCRIVANNKGIVLTNSVQVNERLRDFVFPKKNEENAGLELADFICFYLFKAHFRAEGDKSEFMKLVEKKLYNGNNELKNKDVRRYFGLRVLPEDIETINRLKGDLDRVKKAYDNLKRESRKIFEKNRLLIEEKRKLEEEYITFAEKQSKQGIDKIE